MKEKCNKKKKFLHRKRRALKWDKKTHHLQHIFKAWDHQKKKYLQLRKVEKEKAKKLNRKKHAEERAMKRTHGKVRARHGSKLERLIKRERVAKHHAHKAKRVVKKATKHENKCTKKLHVFQEKGTKAALKARRAAHGGLRIHVRRRRPARRKPERRMPRMKMAISHEKKYYRL